MSPALDFIASEIGNVAEAKLRHSTSTAEELVYPCKLRAEAEMLSRRVHKQV